MDDKHQFVGQELATIEGVTYVSIPDGHALPKEQPKEIAASIQNVVVDDALRSEISAASPIVKFIDQQTVDMIRAEYTVDEEIKALRLAPSEETNKWNAYVEECRSIGRAKKAALGL